MAKQRMELSGVKNLELNLVDCEGCSINGHPLADLLRLKEKEVALDPQESPGGTKVSRRRSSELLDHTELILEDVGQLDDAATNISAAVQETIESSGQKGLSDLFTAAEELKNILVLADKRVARLGECLHKSFDRDDDDDVEDGGESGMGKGANTKGFKVGEKRSPMKRGMREGSLGDIITKDEVFHERSRANSGGSGSSLSVLTRSATNPLESIFPKKIVEALSCDVGDDVAEHRPSVTVLMSDIVGFTAWCSEVSPTKVIECLSAYFQVIDDLAETFGVYKVETVGDGYQAITGAPVYTEDHAEVMALFALKVIETLPTMRKIFNHPDFGVRVGINSGPIVTGVIRADRIRWQLFGDTVNVASRMESTSIPGRIQISKSTRDLLLFRDAFNVEKRGLIEIKGKGHQETFFLNSAREENLFRTKSSRKSFNLLSEFIDLNDHDLADHDNFDSCSTGEPGSPNKHPLPPGQDGAQGGTQGGPGTKGFSDEEEADPKPTVLLVDDLLSILLQYTRVLQREGIHVVTAKNGLEGLDQLKRGKFTCCFCDIHMPKMDGIEMIKAWRKWEEENKRENGTKKKKKLSLFALTGNTDLDKNTAIYLASGFDEVISKTNYKKVLLSYVQNSITSEG